MKRDLGDQELFSVGDIARILSVSESTVRSLVRVGYLPAPHKLPGGRTARWFRLDVLNCLDRLRREKTG